MVPILILVILSVDVRGNTWLTNFANYLSGAAKMYADSCCEKLALPAVLGGPGRGSQFG
jgi:hypothetical protein